MNQISKTVSEQTMARELAELSRKTGLVVKSPDSAAVDMLFAELEKYGLNISERFYEFVRT